jgi:hypothetical protein
MRYEVPGIWNASSIDDVASHVRQRTAVTDFDRQPGGIDDPGMRGGIDPQLDRLPPGDSAGNVGSGQQPRASELDLPEADDPVAWSYVEDGTAVVGPDDEELGVVAAMLGTEAEGIFHGVAVNPAGGRATRVVPADAVTLLTPRRVRIAYDRERLASAPEYRPPETR